MKRRLPTTYYNPVSIIGTGLALFGAAASMILYVIDGLLPQSNPYLGIFIFLVFPAVLVLGLLLIPAGMLWEARRRRRGRLAGPLVIDFGLRPHRNAVLVFISGTSVFLLLTTVGLYGSYEYSESVEFCGEVCHVVMEPEFVAYHNSAHARVACVKCHIGPGAGWYVKSKISGARQVIKTLSDTYPRPIPTPIEDLRPAREVCEQCHWPEKFFAKQAETREYFLSDRDNTRWQIHMLMHVGGVGPKGEHTGSHWHVAEGNRMTYVAGDETRQTIDQVTWFRDGKPVVYTRSGSPLPDSVLAESRLHGREREMDCMDCHTRPAHEYRSPIRCVNQELSAGRLDPGIPWIKRQAVVALSREYHTVEGARDSIRASLESFYRPRNLNLPEAAVEAVVAVYEKNFFPRMKVRWDRYPDNRSHMEFPGCFRCHGSGLQTAGGQRIDADCNMCHEITAQGPAGTVGSMADLSGIRFRHPIDIDEAEQALPCTDCHYGDASLYLPKETRDEMQVAD